MSAAGALTTEEQAYFDSGGNKGEGLLSEQPKDEPKPAEEKPQGEAEKPEEDEGEEKPEGKERGVPQEALHEARLARRRAEERARKIESEAQEWRIERARMTERFNAFMERQQPQATKTDPEPDKAQDYQGWLEWQLRRHEEQIAETRQERQQRQQGEQQQGQQQQFLQAYQAAAEEFKAETPDFDAAYNHVLDHRRGMLKALGYPAAQIGRILAYEEEGLARSAMQAGENPAERIYKAAAQLGYKPGQKGNGQPQKGALETIERGQKMGKTLGGVSGTGQTGAPTLEALANMDPDDFNAFLDGDKRGKKWAKMMGG